MTGAVVEKYCCSKSAISTCHFSCAGPRVERDEIVVGGFEVQRVEPQRRAAVADMRAAARLPVVLPEDMAVVRVERPDIVWCGDVQHVVHHQDRSLDVRRAAGVELAGALAADDHVGPASAASRRQPRHPRQREVLDGRVVDLFQRAEAAAGVVAGIHRPRVGQRLANGCRIEAADVRRLAAQPHRWQREERCEDQTVLHFSVTRYAVTL